MWGKSMLETKIEKKLSMDLSVLFYEKTIRNFWFFYFCLSVRNCQNII